MLGETPSPMRAAASAWRISGMWRWVPPTAYGFAEPRISLASRFGLRALARAARTDGEHRDDVAGIDDPCGDSGREAQADGRGVASGGGDARRADEPLPLLGARHEQLGDAVGPRIVEVAAVEPVPVRDRLEPVVRAGVDDERACPGAHRCTGRTGRAAGPGRRCRGPRAPRASCRRASDARASGGAAGAG